MKRKTPPRRPVPRKTGGASAESVTALKRALKVRNSEMRESLAQQAATSEILRIISASLTDTQPVFDAIVKNCGNLFEGSRVSLWLINNDRLDSHASTGENTREAMPIDRGSAIGLCVLDGKMVHLPDLEKVALQIPRVRQLALKYGYHSGIYAPLLREGRAIGGISVVRREAGAFNDKEVALLKTFADQAVIAIENVRLFNETKEALEQQTATADILKVISSSPTDMQPIFDAIVQSAVRLCNGVYSAGMRLERSLIHLVAHHNWVGEGLAVAQRLFPMPADRDHLTASAIRESRIVHMQNMQSDPEVPASSRELAIATGYQTLLIVPMLREGRAIGAIVVAKAEGPFSDKQVALLQTFADQAVIAIENVRLFNETKEALEQQTATAEILRVISRSQTDVQPVFDIIAERAGKLCGAEYSVVSRFDGEMIHLVALHGMNPQGVAEVRRVYPMRTTDETVTARAVRARAAVQVPDVLADPHYQSKGAALAARYRSGLGVPMLRAGQVIGGIFVARAKSGLFDNAQIELLKTFADQAVIAIENVRLFNETKEALEHQTATGEVLAAMSGSMADTQPVFDAIVRNLLRLFGTQFAVVQLVQDGIVNMPAAGGRPGFERLTERYPRPMDANTLGGQVMLSRQVQQVLALDPAAPAGTQQFARDFGFNSAIFAPMVLGQKVVGAIGTARADAAVFDDKQVALIKTFADQAVIAIENVRLFNETERGARTPDGDQRNSAHHQRFPYRHPAGVRCDRKKWRSPVRRPERDAPACQGGSGRTGGKHATY